MHCPLCGHHEVSLFFADRVREYYCCSRCQLVHVPLRFHLDPSAEKARYDTHRNDPADEGYRCFLSRLARPLQAVVPSGCQGLDFGSGPGPTLSVMLEEMGYQVAIYDKYYACRPELLTRTYDFITATEVVEHLSDPAGELDRLWACLRPGGVLAIMTKLVLDQQAFANWHYIRDLTHISFFSHPTFIWLATHLSARLNRVDKDVIMLHKPLCSDVTPDVPDNPTINQPETHHL
ncbi:class I SAM-dependent methyltransferase [Desulfoplanes formicivorans]|uniref:Methyltransferase n=1 Tax=Desulfoplanes formicivorans TaxID=1592317 RepID=A0A194AK99_9BACT|nr:class I SAM-dependent methyltransferase [Desulfoplanes formicivorans]GAU09139.1 methyltransferase [Desulfoplanes formicivorans]